MSKIVNTDIICIIRQNGQHTLFEKVDIPKSKDQLEALESILKNGNTTVLDMQAKMDSFYPSDRTEINYVSPYSYNDSFIKPAHFPKTINNEEYTLLLEKETAEATDSFSKKNAVLSKNDPDQYSDKLRDYLKTYLNNFIVKFKTDYHKEAIRFIQAKDYDKKLSELKTEENIRMYSTDTVGWSSFDYSITNDITITINTNFGFGRSSYFFLSLKYKDIDILPYSYLVKYCIANMRDLVRHTRSYSPTHDSWERSFIFVEETANLATDNEALFINKWIVEEIRIMMLGLETILNNPKEYTQSLIEQKGDSVIPDYITVRNMTDSDYDTYLVYPHEMTLAIRVEKITGALAFLDNLKKLSSEIPEIYPSINRIKEMAITILPEINNGINELELQIEELNLKKETIEKKIENTLASMEPHTIIINKLYEEERKTNIFVTKNSIEENYAKEHEDYQGLFQDLHQLYEDNYKITNEISKRETFLEELNECKQRIIDAGLINRDVA